MTAETATPIMASKTAMLFFDVLNTYLHPKDAETAAAVEASGMLPAMERMMAVCREKGIAVFYGQADHRPDLKDFAPHIVQLGYNGLPGTKPHKTTPPAAVAGSWEHEIVAELAALPEDYVIKKHRWSTFFQTHLELSLRTAGIDTLMIAGGATEVGIAATAYSGRDLDFNQIILSDACRAIRPGVNEFFMTKVFPRFCRVMTVDQAIGLIA